jgi:hypothetical protein
LYLPIRIYARGADMKIDEYDPANTQTPIVNANVLISPVPNMYIATITKNVESTVPRDLLIVCHKLSSNNFPNNTFFSDLFWMFSLILSNTIIVSLILYHMFVRTAIINTVLILTE